MEAFTAGTGHVLNQLEGVEIAERQHTQPVTHPVLPPGVAMAPLGRRFIAYLIDALLPVCAIVTVGLVAVRWGEITAAVTAIGAGLLLSTWILLTSAMTGRRGASPGMRAMKIQLVRISDGLPIGLGMVLLRSLLRLALIVTWLGLVLLTVLLVLHPRRQGWHDLATNSVMIKAQELPLTTRQASVVPRPWLALPVVIIIQLLFLPAYYGQEEIHQVRPDDIAVARWFYDNAAPGSDAAYFVANNVTRLDYRYLEHPLKRESAPELMTDPLFRHQPNVSSIVFFMQKRPNTPYLIASGSQKRYLDYYGILSPEQYNDLISQIDRSSRFRLRFRDGDASVWERVGA